MSTNNSSIESLIYGYSVAENGQIQPLTWDEVKQETANIGHWRWVHLDRRSEEVQQWLTDNAELDPWLVSALLQEDTRPRVTAHENGYFLNLRGVNLNPGADPEDMVALRIWATENLLITTRARRILAVGDLNNAFLENKAPNGSSGCIAFLIESLINRMAPVVAELDDEVDTMEDAILDNAKASTKTTISGFRRTVLTMRRYIAPQREALAGFLRENRRFLAEHDRMQVQNAQDALIRLAEELDAIRERALLLQELVIEERAEAMNSRLFFLSIISCVFLPLGFFTGLFGVNLAGMPGANSPIAFAVLCGCLVALAAGIVFLFQRMRWI